MTAGLGKIRPERRAALAAILMAGRADSREDLAAALDVAVDSKRVAVARDGGRRLRAGSGEMLPRPRAECVVVRHHHSHAHRPGDFTDLDRSRVDRIEHDANPSWLAQ